MTKHQSLLLFVILLVMASCGLQKMFGSPSTKEHSSLKEYLGKDKVGDEDINTESDSLLLPEHDQLFVNQPQPLFLDEQDRLFHDRPLSDGAFSHDSSSNERLWNASLSAISPNSLSPNAPQYKGDSYKMDQHGVIIFKKNKVQTTIMPDGEELVLPDEI